MKTILRVTLEKLSTFLKPSLLELWQRTSCLFFYITLQMEFFCIDQLQDFQ